MPGRWVPAGRARAPTATAGQETMPTSSFNDDPDRARRFREAALPHLDDVYTLARYLLRDAADAQDAVQECYLRALKHFDGYRGPAMKPWLFAILRNVCRAEYARRAASPTTGVIEDMPETAEQAPLWHEEQQTPEALKAFQKAEIEKMEACIIQHKDPPLDTLAMSDLEEQLDSLLRSHGQNDLWQMAAGLAQRNIQPSVLESIFAEFDPGTARAALVRIAAVAEVYGLLDEIESSTARISDLVLAIKEYTYMDQAPVQNVDIVKSLETTLTILNHKLKRGVTVQREYQRMPLLVNSFGSELNQVWTNIIDNAIDAMGGKGELRVRTYRDDSCVVVEIGDNGPGIAPDVQTHIFEPFFTTKGVGEGTGLGLDTVQRIVKKHRGNIQVTSKPGDTLFQVWLPLADFK